MTIFKSMTREPTSVKRIEVSRLPADWVEPCMNCGGFIIAGDWPWCKGNPEDHAR